MAPRIKMIVNFKLTLEPVFRNEFATFRPASTGLDHALVVCDLTQRLAEGSGCRGGMNRDQG